MGRLLGWSTAIKKGVSEFCLNTLADGQAPRIRGGRGPGDLDL